MYINPPIQNILYKEIKLVSPTRNNTNNKNLHISDDDKNSENEDSKIDLNDNKAGENPTNSHFTDAMLLLDLSILIISVLKNNSGFVSFLPPYPINVVNEYDYNKYADINKGVNNYVTPPSQPSLSLEEIRLNVSNLNILLFHNELDIIFDVPCNFFFKFKILMATLNHDVLWLLGQEFVNIRKSSIRNLQDTDVTNWLPNTHGPFNFLQ